MPVINRVADRAEEVAAWRRDFHSDPELLYEVHRTAAKVAEKLKAFGCDEVATGIGRTGVVGVIRGRKKDSGKVVGLRADMDALPIEEATGLSYARARCTPAVMTATRRCCSAPLGICARRAISTAPRWLSSSPQRRAAPAPRP